MNNFDVYIYGMSLLSTIHLLKDKYPERDTYEEIRDTFVIAGGEGANAAIVLANLGVRCALDGCFFGEMTEKPLKEYLQKKNVDCSLLTLQNGFDGWRDIVFCDGESRTVFGWFVENLFGGKRLWTIPSEEIIKSAKCVALDPFFGNESLLVAHLCKKHKKDFVTIDCHYDSEITRGARAIVCSKEFLSRVFPGYDCSDLINKYLDAGTGLVILTFGKEKIIYASSKENLKEVKPYEVKVVDTLAAGDTFRAGIVYGILNGMNDDNTVQFASACAAVSCTRFPSVYEPPTLHEINKLINHKHSGKVLLQ